jgi:hypothetical protein
MTSSLGHTALVKSTCESGVILGETNSNNQGWKAHFSYDNKVIIQKVDLTELLIGDQLDVEMELTRLIRDIGSESLGTRIIASELLCYFIEETGSQIEGRLLQESMELIVDRISKEDSYDVGQSLGEAIQEYNSLPTIDKSFKNDLARRLALFDKEFLFDFLSNEEYEGIREVSNYLNKRSKLQNTGG